ncbi:MAG: hypothetical protein Q7K43_01740 [Candidatus Woesearchaeota archaeon]|nr:hypothetical protein [Candidatus Woesearchaeota archaeon]
MSVSEKKRTELVCLRAGCSSQKEYNAVRSLSGTIVHGYPLLLSEALNSCGYASLQAYATRLVIHLGWSDLSDFVENSYWIMRKTNAIKKGIPLDDRTIWKKYNTEYEGPRGQSKEKRLALQWLIKETLKEKNKSGICTQGMLARKAGINRQSFSFYSRAEGLPEGKREQEVLSVLVGDFKYLNQVLEAYRAGTIERKNIESGELREQKGVLC